MLKIVAWIVFRINLSSRKPRRYRIISMHDHRLWSNARDIVGLELPPGHECDDLGISNDGSVVIGRIADATPSEEQQRIKISLIATSVIRLNSAETK